VGPAALLDEESTMSASMYASPRPLAPALQAKLRRIEVRLTRRRRIERIRTALQNIVEQLERDREARRRGALGAGDQTPGLLIEALNAATDFDMLVEKLGQ
jgi:hypothetical protein